ncbi:G-protein coupled receptor family C group 5 member C isoform X1 [Callorhinchus milii]|uniref:G-protein coupled receptor family C group 5 member C isoform X1 n=1 Tax=Callorhinchus milii TaxID=7868 RepID=UPI001C3F89BE|nr:G-protein coupled receptor family C group 5 member C isoform X1 [Callorhinchus milii]
MAGWPWSWACVSVLPLVGAAMVPQGCGPDVNALYFNLCDLGAVWGIVLQALSGAGVLSCFVLALVLLASVPFIQEGKKKSTVGTQLLFLFGTLGLFCLVFDFVVKMNFATCASRRFLFGLLFAVCFSCLLTHALRLNFLSRKNSGPNGWRVMGLALTLSLVEAIINTEWLVITILRNNATSSPVLGDPCDIANMDFAMALIYVMVLMALTLVLGFTSQWGSFKHWKKHGVFILVTIWLSVAIWVAWITMYVYGNEALGREGWDDPTLGIALVANAWVFLFFYIVPEICQVTKAGMEQTYVEEVYPTRGVGYETILKEQQSQHMYIENKAFSMDEPNAANKSQSPYGGYSSQLRSSVYQPTEMALMNKNNQLENPYDHYIPRVTINPSAISSNASTLRAEDVFAAGSRQPQPEGGHVRNF